MEFEEFRKAKKLEESEAVVTTTTGIATTPSIVKPIQKRKDLDKQDNKDLEN